jgi:hypothetical protein
MAGPPVAPGTAPVSIELPPRSIDFSELLFTLPGLFILPSVLPPPEGVCASAAPERATVRAAARLSDFIDIAFLSRVDGRCILRLTRSGAGPFYKKLGRRKETRW